MYFGRTGHNSNIDKDQLFKLGESMKRFQLKTLCKELSVIALSAVLLVGCGGAGAPDAPAKASFVPAEGQVTVVTATPTSLNAYAAARFLEQASWGPTPSSVAEVQRVGIEAWVDQQLSLRPSTLNAPNYVINFNNNDQAANNLAFGWFSLRIQDLAMGGQDQLRQRVTWALYNFVTVGNTQPYGRTEYFNLLQKNSGGNYFDFLKEISISSTMGAFLNNDENLASSPNENYARELMQLFSVGLVMLNPDGSIQRKPNGNPIETYSQADVIDATKALSGWNRVYEKDLPSSNYANFGKKMIVRTWPSNAHDTTAKTVLGTKIPAGQTAEKDLDSLLTILVNHPNAGPFVGRRLIQSMVTSDPSPEYIARVSKVFKDSNGNLNKVIKAILLDPEARAGDNPTQSIARVGKIKEPMLHHFNTLRALGCTAVVVDPQNTNEAYGSWFQNPYNAPSVFGFFPPNHKAPESLTPAPEQKLIDSREIRRKADNLNWVVRIGEKNFTNAGCELNTFVKALETSDTALISLISERFFKGAMPAPLRLGAQNLLSKEMSSFSSMEKVTNLLQVLLSTPTYGVVK